ncbi:MAG TPA: hypothetical protein VIV35_06110, partial [Chitinophagaceae bacterium]
LTKTFGQDVQGSWSGFVRCVAEHSGKTGNSVRTVFLTIKENKVSGSETYDEDVIIEGKFYQHNHCEGKGDGQLNAVSIYTSTGTYSIGIEPPECKSDDPSHGADAQVGVVEIADQRLQMKNGKLNMNELSGTETQVSELPGGLGKTTTTTTWQLVRDLDVELIVTPVGYDKTGAQKIYDDWLPEPGKDEISKGSVMKIKLELKSKSGKPLNYKAQSFELKLSNTSSEPGITINYPVSPAANQLPDLRFIPAAIAESNHQDQDITIPCKNGISGETFIASYDGGGRTTLNAEAVLTDGFHIKGQLLVSGGDEDILIPKRDPKSNIAKTWLDQYGNPAETDDKDYSTGNQNDGDGLSAYEEYRGVIAKGKFRRLDPDHKEVGVWVKQGEFSLFKDGIGWFKRATFMDTVVFFDNEIGPDRRLNNNAATANIYMQYVLKLEKGNIGGDVAGENRPITVLAKTPSASEVVVIDFDFIKQKYTDQLNMIAKYNRLGGRQLTMPYTQAESIANTVAHELGHGVGLDHHGPPSVIQNITVPKGDPYYHVYDYFGGEIIDRPFPIEGLVGVPGNDESGDLNCIMAYTSQYQWVRVMNNTINYYAMGLLPLGKGLCTNNAGTGINANNKYFGDATFGGCTNQCNCISRLKLK